MSLLFLAFALVRNDENSAPKKKDWRVGRWKRRKDGKWGARRREDRERETQSAVQCMRGGRGANEKRGVGIGQSGVCGERGFGVMERKERARGSREWG